MFFTFEDTPASIGCFGPFVVLPTSCTEGVPKHITSRRQYIRWHEGEKKKKKNWAAWIKPEIISVSVPLIVSITRWVAASDVLAEGIPSPIKSADTLSGWLWVGGDRRQAIFPVQPGVSHTGQTEVNVLVQHAPTRHSFVVGGKKDHMAVKCNANPARRCCPVCPTEWKSNVDSTTFRTMDRGQWEWFDLQ